MKDAANRVIGRAWIPLAFSALVLRERIMLLQWIWIAAILAGMFFCSS
jgi:drug/metabolite transporter (DMT)-like permease